MLQAIEGIYRNGTIQLAENPQGVSESRVIVTFLESQPIAHPQIMQLGMFAGANQSTEADLQMAEFRCDQNITASGLVARSLGDPER